MKSVEQVLSEPSPATVNYRVDRRSTLQQLIDSGPNGHSPDNRSLKTPRSNGVHSGPAATKLNWKTGVLVPCLLNIWGVIMFLRLGWVVGQAGIWLGTVIIIFANVVTTVTALSMCAICTNGEVKGGGVYFLISRALGPVFGGCIGILFFVAQAVATSLYIVGFGESIVDLMIELGVDAFTGDPTRINDIRVIGISTSVVLLLVALNGIGWYAKCQVGLLIVLVIAMISVFVGAFLPDMPNEEENMAAGFVGFGWRNQGSNFQTDPTLPEVTQNFFTVFAVFFPAVTGIMAGANLSGDLDDPSRSLPKGTLTAIAVTFVSYIALLWFVGLTCYDCVGPYCPEIATPEWAKTAEANGTLPQGGLLYNKLIMKNVSFWAPLVYIGVFAATLSSALASLVGAPRILQSVAHDKLFPWSCFNYFAKGVGAGNEPYRAYFLTFFITCAFVSIGRLDVIAPLISNFFMISYAMTNYACFASSASKAPGWRPSFKYYNKWLSGFGALLCLVVMFLIDWVTALVTVIICFAIFRYLIYINPDVNWGEAGEAKKYVNALHSLETLQFTDQTHVKTFRPQFLVLTGPLDDRVWLVKFVALLQKGRGLMVCGDIIVKRHPRASARSFIKAADDGSNTEITIGDEKEAGDDSSGQTLESMASISSDDKHHERASDLATEYELAMQRRKEGDEFLMNPSIWNRKCPGAFCEVTVAPTLFDGIQTLLQTSGIGRMRPNTIVMGFKHDWKEDSVDEVARYERAIRAGLSAHLGLMVVRDDHALLDLNMKTFTGSGSEKNSSNCLSCCRKQKPQVEVKATDNENGSKHRLGYESTHTVELTNSLDEHKVASRLKRKGTHKPDALSSTRNVIERALPSTLPGNRVDVWWLTDDGGLTMLLPHMLVQNPRFKSHSLRVMAVSTSLVVGNVEFQETERKMAHLLNKFRINAETIGVDLNLNLPVAQETISRFESLGTKLDELNNEERLKTNFQLRLSEVVRERSKDASIIFIILPIPDTGLRVRLFCSWLDMLSADMPPMVMMRGNNENVLTFFC